MTHYVKNKPSADPVMMGQKICVAPSSAGLQ
jgi:hypothetical protein